MCRSCPYTSISTVYLIHCNASLTFAQTTITVGCDESSGVVLKGVNIAQEHAKLQWKGGRVYCTALAGKPGDFMADTFTWVMPDTQLRGGVDYLISPGAELSFGELGSNLLKVDFAEAGGNSAMVDMLMKGMAQTGSAEVRKMLDERS